MAILGMILPMLLPAVTDGVRGLIARFTGGAGGMPANMPERIQLMEAETKKLMALAELDRPTGNVSKWVSNLRASFRYIAIIAIWGVTGVAVITGATEAYVLVLLDLSGMCMSFVIGERFYLKLTGKG